ncbi:MAG: Crp/Fnr family transcriptional regulator [Bacteroidia bacterium]
MYEQIKSYFLKFIPLDEAQWALIESGLEKIVIPKKTILLHAGEVCRHAWFIDTGCMRYFYNTYEGMEITGYIFTENAFVSSFGSFVSRQPSTQSIDAIEDSELTVISYAHMRKLYDHIPQMERFGRLLAENIVVGSQMRTASLLVDDPETRYQKLLRERPELLVRIPHYYIASYLGIKPETLSRIRKRLSKK